MNLTFESYKVQGKRTLHLDEYFANGTGMALISAFLNNNDIEIRYLISYLSYCRFYMRGFLYARTHLPSRYFLRDFECDLSKALSEDSRLKSCYFQTHRLD